MLRTQRICKRLKDSLGALQDIVIPKSQHGITFAAEPIIPASI